MAPPPSKVPADSKNAAARMKAVRIRAKVKVGGAVSPEEAAWYADYQRARDGAKNGRDAGASARRSHKVSYSEESEEAAAVGTGAAAETAAAAAMVREEGRRLDSIVDRGFLAMQKACEFHERMCEALLNRAIEDGKTHRRLLDSLRVNALARIKAEVRARGAEPEEDEIVKLAKELAPILGPMFGVKAQQADDDGGGYGRNGKHRQQ
jgi:nucleotide-binding universal stress UspA family protein